MSKKSLIVVFTLLLAGCNPNANLVIVLMGDSIMENNISRMSHVNLFMRSNSPLLIHNAIGGAPLVLDYWPGRIASINTYAVPEIIFISLGTNDALAGTTVADVAAQIDAIMAAVNLATMVYWIPPHQGVGGDREAVYNSIIIAQWPNMAVLDFDLWMQQEGLNPTAMLTSDNIHLSVAGNSALTDMMMSVY